jgi:glycine/D-amino acid oxidase-like deaminating enzyme
VLVVDREGVGWGASSRNGGQVLTGLRLEPADLVARYGEARARRLYEAANDAIAHLESLIADERIDCEYERRGHIQAAWKPAHFKAFAAERALLARVFGHRVELVDRSGQRAEIGSDRYHGLLVDERSGGLNPAQYVRGLAAAATRAGARLACGVAVQDMDHQPSGWQVRTSAGTIASGAVLIATNGYTDKAAPELRRRLVPVGSYIVATERLTADQAAALLPTRRVAFDSKNFLYYFRVTADRRLLFGGRAEFTPPGPHSIPRAEAILERGIATVFPELTGVPIEYAWGGNVAFTRDEMPHAGRIGDAYFAGGYCGHGIAMATELGDLIARRMGGDEAPHPLLELECPTIPLYHGTPWFLPLAGAYYKMKDWIS